MVRLSASGGNVLTSCDRLTARPPIRPTRQTDPCKACNQSPGVSSLEAYWYPGTPRIEIKGWVLCQQQGSWALVTLFFNKITNNVSSTWQPATSQADWILNPRNIQTEQTVQVTEDLSYWVVINQDLRSCMAKSQIQSFGNPKSMITTEKVESVTTPIYSGPAVSLDFCEIDLPAPSNGDCNRAHEK